MSYETVSSIKPLIISFERVYCRCTGSGGGFQSTICEPKLVTKSCCVWNLTFLRAEFSCVAS